MKKVIVVLILSLILFSLLFAEEVEKKENKITFWEGLGIFILILFFIVIILITSVIISQGLSDSGKIAIKLGEKINLKLRNFLETEKEEITLKFLVKKIVGNKITLQCEICRQGKTLLTKVIGIEKGKKVNTQIKKILNFPIRIFVHCPNSNDENQIKIDVERVVPITNVLLEEQSAINWN